MFLTMVELYAIISIIVLRPKPDLEKYEIATR